MRIQEKYRFSLALNFIFPSMISSTISLSFTHFSFNENYFAMLLPSRSLAVFTTLFSVFFLKIFQHFVKMIIKSRSKIDSLFDNRSLTL